MATSSPRKWETLFTCLCLFFFILLILIFDSLFSPFISRFTLFTLFTFPTFLYLYYYLWYISSSILLLFLLYRILIFLTSFTLIHVFFLISSLYLLIHYFISLLILNIFLNKSQFFSCSVHLKLDCISTHNFFFNWVHFTLSIKLSHYFRKLFSLILCSFFQLKLSVVKINFASCNFLFIIFY